MPELLFELGCEELPASQVRRAYEQLLTEITARLSEAGIGFGASRAMGTPRRLIVQVQEVGERQPDQTKEMRGPGVKAAYDSSGNPTGALLGFCKGQGVEVSAVRTEGDYVWVTKHIPGLSTAELLQTILPDSVRALSFDKTMRWGSARMRFARPIRWLLAAFGGAVVSFEIEGVHSGLESRGHRFNSPSSFEASSSDQLLTELRSRQVEPDPSVRCERIVEGAKRVASGLPEMTEALIEENVFLTEWPEALEGTFRPEFEVLPEPVLITAMAKHERFFPVRGGDGKLLNKFVSIRNGGEESVVRDGNAWVLNARFNDAKFFFDEDKKFTLADFMERTKLMAFQEKLGSVYDRASRLEALAREVAVWAGMNSAEQVGAALAAKWCKADLGTGLVSELASLQGTVGAEYAAREGLPAEVSFAIGAHYDVAKAGDGSSANSRLALCVLMADQIDKLVGYLGVGHVPSGSSDPYGLRRAVHMLITSCWDCADDNQSQLPLFRKSLNIYAQAGHYFGEVNPALFELFAGRYRAILTDRRYDLVEAALLEDSASELLFPGGVRRRLELLEALAGDTDFVFAATRPLNIVAAAVKKGVAIPSEIDAARLESAEGTALLEALRACSSVDASSLKSLQGPINAFFDSTMVMVDDEAVRGARLALLQQVSDFLKRGGDWTRVVIE